MCIIAVLPPKCGGLTEEELSNCWDGNSDGAGFAYVADGKVKIRKGFMEQQAFERAFNNVYKKHGDSSPFIVHFRIRTHGLSDAERTHPFKIDDFALAHNGVLGGFIDHIKSDTQLFIEKYSSFLTKDFLASKENLKELEEAIGYNKFALLYPDASFTIVGESLGQWHNARWFSNGSYNSLYGGYSRRYKH
jgi:predicted glutamine amidotransferase